MKAMRVWCSICVLSTVLLVALATAGAHTVATYVVKPDGTGDFPTIQSAIDAAEDGDTVELTDGTFTGDGNRDIDYLGKAITVRSQSGDQNACIIDCEGQWNDRHRGFLFTSGEGATSVLEGVTIRNGYGGGVVGGKGGGMYCDGTSPTVTNCTLLGNGGGSGGRGGGNGDGGGMYCSAGSPTLTNCTLSGNYATNGGGIYCDGASPTLINCTLSGNSGLIWDGYYSYYSRGGGMYCRDGSSPTLVNTIFTYNRGLAILCEDANSEPILTCSDVYGNKDGDGDIHDWVDCIEGQNGIDGNISADPLFCDPGNRVYTLGSNSPCAPENNEECGLIGAWPVGCTVRGACCFDDGSCRSLFDSACIESSGTFLGEGVACEPNPCPSGGSCCFETGMCEFLTETACTDVGGNFLGDEIPCDPNSCPQPGACCFAEDCVDELTADTCEADGGTFFGEGTICPENGCEGNAGGVLILHANPDLQFSQDGEYCGTSDLSDCGSVRSTVPVEGQHVFHAIAAFVAPWPPRLSGITFGIDYDSDTMGLLGFGPCGDFELPSGEWPAPSSGTAVTWGEPQTSSLIEVYWFAAYSYYETAGVISLASHPTQGAFFADDAIPSRLDPIACLGSLGFGTDGGGCCGATTGACCLPSMECVILTMEECDAEGGSYEGPNVPCDPDPCIPTPILLAQPSLRQNGFVVELSWETPADFSIVHFDVLRARVGNEPVPLGRVEPASGAYLFEDATIETGTAYQYWIEIVGTDGLQERFGPWEIRTKNVERLLLMSQQPNPTRDATHIQFYLPGEQQVVLRIFDAVGRVVHSTEPSHFDAGVREVTWNGRSETGRPVPTGVYMFVLRAGPEELKGKVLVAR